MRWDIKVMEISNNLSLVANHLEAKPNTMNFKVIFLLLACFSAVAFATKSKRTISAGGSISISVDASGVTSLLNSLIEAVNGVLQGSVSGALNEVLNIILSVANDVIKSLAALTGAVIFPVVATAITTVATLLGVATTVVIVLAAVAGQALATAVQGILDIVGNLTPALNNLLTGIFSDVSDALKCLTGAAKRAHAKRMHL